MWYSMGEGGGTSRDTHIGIEECVQNRAQEGSTEHIRSQGPAHDLCNANQTAQLVTVCGGRATLGQLHTVRSTLLAP